MNLVKLIKRFFYAIPFGMKGADDIIFSQKSSTQTDNVGVVQVLQENRLSKDLLKGEITQQVEELRYKDYKVYNESKKYKYLGDGNATKIEYNDKDLSNFSFIIENKIICENVFDELNRIDNYGSDRYILSFIYGDIPKFKLESYVSRLEVNFINGKCEAVLCFSKYPNKYDVKTKAFINELQKINNGDTEYLFKNHEICSNITSIEFTTYKAINEDDFIHYKLDGFTCFDFVEEKHEFKIYYTVKSCNRENLLTKFYSKTMDDKYMTKQKKDNTYVVFNEDRVEKCSECGAEINKYDSDITKETYGKSLCLKCLEEKILKDYNNGIDINQ